MNILDRIRAAFLRRELARIQGVDHAARDQVRTTDDLMVGIIERTTRIIELQNKIRELEGEPDDEPESEFGTGIPTGFKIPTKGGE